MALNITKHDVDIWRKAIETAEPYTKEEILQGSEDADEKRLAAYRAKVLLEHFGLSLSDKTDYGDIKE